MKYISLGYFCSVAIELERLGLRSESSPFDWVISDFEGVILAIQDRFADYLEYKYLSQNQNKREIYKNVKYNIAFYHDFDKYTSLSKQLPSVKDKYARRIKRFFSSITTEPTLFIRYISDEVCHDGKSVELAWIEKNYEQIMSLLKSFNVENDILFIANEGVRSEIINIYNVKKDENDTVARNPIHANTDLFDKFSKIDYPGKQDNIIRWKKKEQKKESRYFRIRGKIIRGFKRLCLKEYIHESQF